MHNINVSIVYALADKQFIKEFVVARGTSAEELLEKSGFQLEIDALADLDRERLKLGIYGQKINHDYLLQEGDRLEIYRPLTADPKEVRRQLALLGKTIGKK